MKPLLLAAAALLALPFAVRAAESAPAAPSAVETLRWQHPWSAGRTLVYATERLDRKVSAKGREETRITDTTEVRITQASTDGFVQQWRSSGATVEVIEGDRAMGEAMQAAERAFSRDNAVEVALDRDGNYLRIRNIDTLSPRLREAMRPLVVAGIDAELRRQATPVDAAAHEAAMRQVDAMLDRMIAPPVLEAMIGRALQTYNGFVGVDLEPGEWYELETSLPSPLGGEPFPAKLQLMLQPSESDPDDVFLEWNSRIDPEKGAAAIWALTEKLLGTTIPAEARKALPDAIDLRDEGFFVFRRGTGEIEMFETVRTVKVGDTQKTERQRMRRVNGDHERHWNDDGDGDGAEG